MLAASDDRIDLIHDHPFIADGGRQLQFNIIFPRARTYKIWVQFQRKGVVNTAAFTGTGVGVEVALTISSTIRRVFSRTVSMKAARPMAGSPYA